MKQSIIKRMYSATRTPIGETVAAANGKTADHYMTNAAQMTDKSLRSRLCRAGDIESSPVLCEYNCPCMTVCEYGKEYMRRKAVTV